MKLSPLMQKRLLLIVDDEDDLLELFDYYFSTKGFEVEVFNRAQAALTFIEQRIPDIILCDWMMPEMTGLEMCRTVKENIDYAGIPFVMVTCRNEVSAKKEAIQAGVTKFIPKPVRMPILLEQVNSILRRS